MRFCSLGSGSSGNSLIVEEQNTSLLLDCGFNIREMQHKLARADVIPEKITGILVTHEHDDHASGVFRLASRYNIPVWLTHGTLSMVARYLPKTHNIIFNVIDCYQALAIGDIQVQPFPVPHDAREPVQYTFSNGDCKLGVLTDTGTTTPHIEKSLNACSSLVLECNHDREMLMNGPYSRALKARISGKLGHLDNQCAAELLGRLDNSKLQHIIAAHLSETNNRPEIARMALANVLNCSDDWVGVAHQQEGFTWRSL